MLEGLGASNDRCIEHRLVRYLAGHFIGFLEVACTGLAMIGLNFLDDRRRASDAGSREPGLAYLDAA
jgi:hypothetical protein